MNKYEDEDYLDQRDMEYGLYQERITSMKYALAIAFGLMLISGVLLAIFNT